MSVKTLTVPSADEQQRLVYNRKVRVGNTEVLQASQKFAVVLLRFEQSVEPGHYPAMGSSISEIQGIQGVTLLVDGAAGASCPANTEFKLVTDVQLRIDDLPEE